MQGRTKKLFGKLAQLTGTKCGNCDCAKGQEFRCCDRMFCSMVQENLERKNIQIDPPNVGGIPFMGEKGCVVPVHLRPHCTGFVCPENFLDKKFAKQYDKIVEEITKDESAPSMPERPEVNSQKDIDEFTANSIRKFHADLSSGKVKR